MQIMSLFLSYICRAVHPEPRTQVPKQGEKSVPPQAGDLPGLSGFPGNSTGLRGSGPLCGHSCSLGDTPIVEADNQNLSYILLISLLLCVLCSPLFIGHPNTAKCLLRQITFEPVFTVAVSAVLVKTISVVLMFKAMEPGRTMRGLLVSGPPNAVIPICFLIQLTLCGFCLGVSPPFVSRCNVHPSIIEKKFNRDKG